MVAVSTAASLGELAQELLTASEQIIADTSGGPVALSFLAPSIPTLDHGCDQIIVWCSGIPEEQTSPLTPIPQTGMRRRVGWLNLVNLNVWVARCLDVRRVPVPPATSTEDAEKVMEDGWALINGLSSAFMAGDLFDGTCRELRFLSMVPLNSEGGMGGWALTVQVELGGYRA